MERETEKLIRNISFFKGIPDNLFLKIKDNLKLESFSAGERLIDISMVPNKVSFIISGTIRSIYEDNNGIFTLEKGGYGFPIGIVSLLRNQGCENILTSSKVNLFSITDKFFFELIDQDDEFKKLIFNNVFYSEIIDLIEKSEYFNKNELNAYNWFCKLKNNFKISTRSNLKDSYFYFTAFKTTNFDIGDIYNQSINLNASDINRQRYIKIKKVLLTNNTEKKIIQEIQDNSKNKNSKKEIYKKGEYPFKSQYFDKNYEKLEAIKTDDPVDDVVNLVNIICNKLSTSFRRDSIYKFVRDEINLGREINLDFLAEILTMSEILVGNTKVSAKNLNRVPLSILEFKNKFYIINKTSLNSIQVYSSSNGIENFNTSDFNNDETKIYEVLIVRKKINAPTNKFGFKWFLPLLVKNKNTLIQLLISSFVIQLFTLANPLLMQVIIDKVISQRSLDTLQVLGITLLVVTILEAILKLARTYIFNETTNRIDLTVGSEVINHLLRLPQNYFDKRPVGELSTRVAELERIREFFTGQVLTTTIDAVFSIIYIFVLFLYSTLLTLISLSVIPIQVLITLIGGPIFKYQHRETTKLNAITQNHLVESITGIQNVKTQNIENTIGSKWQKNYSKYIGKSFQKNILGSSLNESSQFLQKVSQLFVLWVGASMVIDGKLTLGQLIAFRIISGYVTQPILRLSTLWQRLEELKISFERLADIMDRETEKEEKSNIILMPKLKGKILYSNISYSFSEFNKPVIKNINIEFQQNTINGIVGRSGSGKSTLIKLLSRIYAPTNGKIIVDGYDINKVDINSYRKQLGVVMQDPYLFNGTISENIAITKRYSTSEEIIRAAKIASAHDFIMDQPNGYDTFIGERGSLLSGGQRQRIAIARAVLNNPKILILDEATSALDYKSEENIISNLLENFGESTVLFVTHRTTSLYMSKAIFYLEDGLIVENGSYDQLIADKKQFYALTKIQNTN